MGDYSCAITTNGGNLAGKPTLLKRENCQHHASMQNSKGRTKVMDYTGSTPKE
jgi:hypothetical protein